MSDKEIIDTETKSLAVNIFPAVIKTLCHVCAQTNSSRRNSFCPKRGQKTDPRSVFQPKAAQMKQQGRQLIE